MSLWAMFGSREEFVWRRTIVYECCESILESSSSALSNRRELDMPHSAWMRWLPDSELEGRWVGGQYTCAPLHKRWWATPWLHDHRGSWHPRHYWRKCWCHCPTVSSKFRAVPTSCLSWISAGFSKAISTEKQRVNVRSLSGKTSHTWPYYWQQSWLLVYNWDLATVKCISHFIWSLPPWV